MSATPEHLSTLTPAAIIRCTDWLGRRVQIEGLDMGTVVSNTDEGILIRLDKTGKQIFAFKYDIQESPGLWAS